MREKIEPVMHIVDIAEEAMKQLNINPIIRKITIPLKNLYFRDQYSMRYIKLCLR